ncbi:MAG: autotransporter domain-containing protein [Chthoniobacterales bacterium]
MNAQVSLPRMSSTALTVAVLATAFLATEALAQQLMAPPNQSPAPGTDFSSTTTSTVIANPGGQITLTDGTVSLNATSGGQVAALLATGANAEITATGVTIVNNNLQGTSITFGANAGSGAVINLHGGTIDAMGSGGGRGYGINAGVGGTVDASALTLDSIGANGHAIVAGGGTINLVGGSITTNGSFSLGLQANANAGPATITVDGTTIKTLGPTSSGPRAEGTNNATINLTNATIDTEGDNAHGLIAIGSGKTITSTNTNIITIGSSAVGATAFGGAQIDLAGGMTTTSGTGAAGLAVSPGQTLGSTLIATGSTISTAGTNGDGILITLLAPLTVTNVVSLNNTKVTTQQGDGISWDGQSNTDVSLKNETAVVPGNGVLLRALAGSPGAVLNLTADGNVALEGDVLVGTGSIVNVNLLNNSVLTGAMQNANNVAIETGSRWDITGSSTIGSLTFNGGTLQFNNAFNLGITRLITLNAFGGTINTNGNDTTISQVIGGVGALTKDGAGRLTLTGQNTYTGGTHFNGGILAVEGEGQLGPGPLTFNGGTLEELSGRTLLEADRITLDPAGGTFFSDADTTSTLSGILEGPGSFTKNGPGTLTLSGENTFSGGTIIEDGTLIAGIPTALGTGDVSLQGGTLRTPSLDPLAIIVGGNYKQGPGGTLALGVAGVDGKDYDRVQVGGNASLNGTLAVSSLNNFRPANGNAFEVLHTNGTRSGHFAQVNDSLNNNPNLERIDVYAPNGVALVYVAGTKPPIIEDTPDPLPPIGPEEPLPPLLAILDPTAEQLTSLFEISFSGANTQRFNLEDRLAEIQRGSTGFVSHLPAAPAPYEGKTSVAEGKSVVEKQPVLQPTPENRWGVWVNGWGDFVSVDNDSFAKGYDFTTGGVTVGIDYRITDHLAIGLFGSYAHTWTHLQPAGDVDVNTGRGGLYATYFDRGFYVNGGVYGGYNSYDTSRQGLLALATGSTSGYEFSTFLETGYDFHFGNFAVGPVGSVQYTNVHVNGFSEQSSVLPLKIHSDSEESWRTDLGVQASYTCHWGNVLVVPTVRTAWEHEFKYSALPITVSSAAFPGVSATFFGPNEGHDSAIINAGLGVQWTARISTYVGYQGQLGRSNYDANGVTGSVSFSF